MSKIKIFFDWFNKIAVWTTLRAVGNSPAVKLTILIPLVGYLILFNENILHYFELSRELLGAYQRSEVPNTAIPMHVSARLLLVYFGLCFIAVASILYAWCCPQEIKAYGSPTEYIGHTADNISMIERGAIEHYLKNGDTIAQSLLSELRDIHAHRPRPQDRGELERDEVEFGRGVLDLYFQYLDRRHPIARRITLIFFVVGFLALAIPSFEIFVRVCILLLAHAILPFQLL